MPPLLSKAAWSAHKGWSKAYTSKLIRLGKITPPAVTEAGMIDVAEAERQLAAVADPARQPARQAQEPAKAQALQAPEPPADEPEPVQVTKLAPFAAAKARREQANAELAEMELRRKRGELVEKAAAEAAMEELGHLIVQQLDERRHRLAQRLTGLPSPMEVAAILEEADLAMRRTLAEEGERHLARMAQHA